MGDGIRFHLALQGVHFDFDRICLRRRLLWPTTGSLRWPVMGYLVIITLMGLVAFSLPSTVGFNVIVSGTVLFIISDFTLSQQMFVLRKDSAILKFTPYLVWSTYWSALALI